jgi:hypothetical protein
MVQTNTCANLSPVNVSVPIGMLSRPRFEDETIVRMQGVIDHHRGKTQVLNRYGFAKKPDR